MAEVNESLKLISIIMADSCTIGIIQMNSANYYYHKWILITHEFLQTHLEELTS